MEAAQYIELINAHSPLFYFVINRMMDIKIIIGIIGVAVSVLTFSFILVCTKHDIEELNNRRLTIPIILSGPILLIIAVLIPDPDTLRHVVATSLMDQISTLDLEQYKEDVNTITQFIKEAY